MECNISVSVRVRPSVDNNVIKYINTDEGEPSVLMVADKRNIYAFDNIFSNEVHQCEIYNITVKPFVIKVLDGYNCTILAYGQTGTGKTYTMGTDSERYHDIDSGLIPRVLEEFIDICNKDSEITISISFIEIYNEKVYDLLRPSKTALTVRGFCVHGITCVPVERNEEAQHWLLIGGKGRHVRHTVQNASSSRSHAIFTIYCTKINSGITSKLHLVDLAGSESVRRTGNQGQAFYEGITINKGLLAVGQVIRALSDKRTTVIPYRDSTLTTILHDSLSINNYVSLLACISPSENDVSETLATLRFAVKAKTIKSRPQLENILIEYDIANPGELGNIEPISTTVKKKRKPSTIYTSHVKRPRFGNKNMSIQSVDLKSGRFTSSPNLASTMDSLSISSSTVNEASKNNFNLSSLVERCTKVLESTVREHINSIIQEKRTDTKALFSLNEDKENISPTLIDHWQTVENRETQIIKKELAERNVSPCPKKILNFDSPELDNSNTVSSGIKSENLFKVPIPSHRAVQRLKELDQQNVAVNTSPVSLRRSSRLSIKNLCSFVPKPTPRQNILKSIHNIKESNTSNCSSPFKPTRRSIRLSMKYIPQITMSPKPKRIVEHDSSFEGDFLPVPAPRFSTIKTKISSNKSNKTKKSPVSTQNLKWKTPKKILNSPHKLHKFKILRLLNCGTQKELSSLSTVGVKTALQIFTYRSLNGEFKTFEDMKKIPAWGDKKYIKFMLGNQLM